MFCSVFVFQKQSSTVNNAIYRPHKLKFILRQASSAVPAALLLPCLSSSIIFCHDFFCRWIFYSDILCFLVLVDGQIIIIINNLLFRDHERLVCFSLSNSLSRFLKRSMISEYHFLLLLSVYHQGLIHLPAYHRTIRYRFRHD